MSKTEVSSTRTPASLAVSGLGVQFGGVKALDDVTFAVGRGEVLAVVGPNGAGKSTLLNAVSGLLRSAITGSILIGDRPAHDMGSARIARLGVGRSFQDPPLVDAESVRENMLIGQYLLARYSLFDQVFRRRQVDSAERAAGERIERWLSFMDLERYLDEPAGGLPYGVRKLIDIARAIASQPALLLLDEPTSGLDVGEQRQVAAMLKRFHLETSTAILIVEHHMEVVRALANRVVGLQSGRVIALGTPAEVLDSSEFRSALVGGSEKRD